MRRRGDPEGNEFCILRSDDEFAVVDQARTMPVVVGALVVAVLVALAIADAVAVVAARRTSSSIDVRDR